MTGLSSTVLTPAMSCHILRGPCSLALGGMCATEGGRWAGWLSIGSPGSRPPWGMGLSSGHIRPQAALRWADLGLGGPQLCAGSAHVLVQGELMAVPCERKTKWQKGTVFLTGLCQVTFHLPCHPHQAGSQVRPRGLGEAHGPAELPQV